MKKYLYIAGFSAIPGFVIALLGGIFGPVDFLTMLFRMFVASILCATLGAIIAVVIQRFLPELWDTFFDAGNAPEAEADEPMAHADAEDALGEMVDIVVDDDMDQAMELGVQEGEMPAMDMAADQMEKPAGDAEEALPQLEELEDLSVSDETNGNSLKQADDSQNNNEDPKVLAKAIQSMLNKE